MNHARYMIQMLDKALGLLGPDAEVLEEILTDRKFAIAFGYSQVFGKYRCMIIVTCLQ